MMRKGTKQQKKIQKAKNHQTKVNVLNQTKDIQYNQKISINTKKNLCETRSIAAIKIETKYYYKFVKNN